MTLIDDPAHLTHLAHNSVHREDNDMPATRQQIDARPDRAALISCAAELLDAYDIVPALRYAADEGGWAALLHDERFVHFALCTLAELKRLETLRPTCDHPLTETGRHDWDSLDWETTHDEATNLDCTDNAYGLIDDLIDHPIANFYLTGLGATVSNLFADALTA